MSAKASNHPVRIVAGEMGCCQLLTKKNVWKKYGIETQRTLIPMSHDMLHSCLKFYCPWKFQGFALLGASLSISQSASSRLGVGVVSPLFELHSKKAQKGTHCSKLNGCSSPSDISLSLSPSPSQGVRKTSQIWYNRVTYSHINLDKSSQFHSIPFIWVN